MLFEIEVDEVPQRFAEMMATLEAGYGVLILKGGAIVARMLPESAFADADPFADLTPEEREARELAEMIEADMNDSF
jgi:antitoxin (DNA-binding transcriptional repressor) of toxin-antitoxin stability system